MSGEKTGEKKVRLTQGSLEGSKGDQSMHRQNQKLRSRSSPKTSEVTEKQTSPASNPNLRGKPRSGQTVK